MLRGFSEFTNPLRCTSLDLPNSCLVEVAEALHPAQLVLPREVVGTITIRSAPNMLVNHGEPYENVQKSCPINGLLVSGAEVRSWTCPMLGLACLAYKP